VIVVRAVVITVSVWFVAIATWLSGQIDTVEFRSRVTPLDPRCQERSWSLCRSWLLEDDMKKMTEEYCKLSVRAGIIAGTLQRFQQNSMAIKIFREFRWELTPEFLEQIKRDAIAEGVPAEELEVAEAMAAGLMQDAVLMRRALEMQHDVDQLLGVKEDDPTTNRQN